MSTTEGNDTAIELYGEEQSPTVVQAITTAEVDVQVTTAKRYPRSIRKVLSDAKSMATLDEDTAESCFYTLPRKDKSIQGPGIRLAEIFASCWGNLRCEARVIDEDDRFITARGVAWDMENNLLMSTEVRRRITDKYGKKYSDDMITVTANAACSIALRNAIFKVIPRSLVDQVYLMAKECAVGTAKTLTQRRDQVIARFVSMGAMQVNILRVIGKESVEEIDLRDLEMLIGIGTAIKDGTTTIDEAFPKAPDVKAPVFAKSVAKDATLGNGEPTTTTEPEPTTESDNGQMQIGSAKKPLTVPSAITE